MWRNKPVVGIICDVREESGTRAHMAAEEYVAAAADIVGAVPFLIPAVADRLDPADILAEVDGLLMTGARSNLAPHHYDAPPAPPETLADPARDDMALGLIKAAVAKGVPLFCICRGFQEFNVAFGGTLHQDLAGISGRMNHGYEADASQDEKYAPAHSVAIEPGGVLAALLNVETLDVNSLHFQGIDRLSPELRLEATAADGTVEAASHSGARSFALGVQWHPEWGARENPSARRLFEGFAGAVREQIARRSA